jgi:GTPase
MFVDQAKIFVRGGRGGNGCMSFRREKFVPRGGPDGGNGGDGGNVVVQSDAALSTLLDLRYHSFNFASNGAHGKGKNMYGKRGEDLRLRVPPGTILKDVRSPA